MDNFITYNDQQLDQETTLKSLDSKVLDYVSLQPWSKKKKERFLNAYSDMRSKGIVSISDKGVDIKGSFDLNSLSNKDLEMYHAAAYYIMNNVDVPKDSKKEAKNLPTYDYESHINGIESYIGNNIFGGKPWEINRDWADNFDPRDPNTGIRSQTGRANKLAEMLEGYSKSLEEGKFNFENSPYKSLEDLKTKINNAVTQLKNGTFDLGDIDALNQIGLDWRKYLSDGSDDEITLSDGTTTTYGQYYDALNKAQQEAGSLNTTTTQKPDTRGVLNLLSGIHSKEAREKSLEYLDWIAGRYGTGNNGFNAMNTEILSLLERGYLTKLNAAEKKLLGNLLYYIRTNNPRYKLSNISDAEWKELNIHKNLGSTNRKGFVRLPWKTSDGRYIYGDDKGNVYYLKPSNNQQYAAPTFTKSAEYNKYKLNFLKNSNLIALSKTIGENGGLTPDMYADLTAAGLDVVSAGSAFVPGYGTAASAISGVGSTISGAVADRMRGESWGSTLGTAAVGLGLDLMGLIPGAGVSSKAAKIASRVAKMSKWLGPALAAMSAVSYGPGAYSAYNKIMSGKFDDITSEEFRDLTYAFRAIGAGGIRKAGATRQNSSTLRKAVADGRAETVTGKQSASITTKNNLVIKLTDDEYKTLRGSGSRSSKDNVIAKAAKRQNIDLEGDEILWKGFNPTRGRFRTASKSSKVSGLAAPVTTNGIKWNTTSADYTGIRRFSNENLLRNYMLMDARTTFPSWSRFRNRFTGEDIFNTPIRTGNAASTVTGSTTNTTSITPTGNTSARSTSTSSSTPASSSSTSAKPTNPTGNTTPTTSTGSGTPTSTVTSTSTPAKPKSISSSEARVELRDVMSSYGIGTKKPTLVKGGYNSGNVAPDGTFTYNIRLADGSLINTSYSKDLFGNIVVRVGNTLKSFDKGQFLSARLYMAQQVYNLYKNKNIDLKATGNLLKQYKNKGILRLGGIIREDLNTTISNFLKEYNS